MGWVRIQWELSFDVNPKTLERALDRSVAFVKRDACMKGELAQPTKNGRYAWCNKNLTPRPTPEHWGRSVGAMNLMLASRLKVSSRSSGKGEPLCEDDGIG